MSTALKLFYSSRMVSVQNMAVLDDLHDSYGPYNFETEILTSVLSKRFWKHWVHMVGEFGVKCTSLDHQQMNGNPMELNRPTRKVDFGSSKCSSKKLNPNSNVKQFSQDGFNFLDIFFRSRPDRSHYVLDLGQWETPKGLHKPIRIHCKPKKKYWIPILTRPLFKLKKSKLKRMIINKMWFK